MLPPPVIYEDDALIAFDKPSGLPVAPDPRAGNRRAATLMGMVRGIHGRQLANVHRLDTDASGLVLCARTKPALDFVSGQFQAKTVTKVYQALVAVLPAERALPAAAPLRSPDGGLPESFAVDLALGEDERLPGRMRVCKGRGGRDSRTEFRVLESFGRFALLECRPLTGRPHQLRVHLAALGAPVLNDALYGDPTVALNLSDLKRGYKGREEEKPLITRLALHASGLTFTHPVSRDPLTLASSLPHEFAVALKYLRKFGGRGAPGRRAHPTGGSR